MSTSAGTRTRPDARTLATRGAVAVVASLAVNLIIVAAVKTTGAIPPVEPLDYPPVAIFTAVGAVGATAVYAVLTRWSDSPDRTFAVVAAVVLVLSFVPDVTFVPTLPGATTAAVIVLMVMHATVAGICYAVLTR